MAVIGNLVGMEQWKLRLYVEEGITSMWFFIMVFSPVVLQL